MNIEKNIVAIGGGGFGRTVKDLRIEEYILNLSKKDKPNICFIPTATEIMMLTRLIIMMFLQNLTAIQRI